MTGGGRAPAVAHERTEKQDLGLDASSHFAAEGVLHSLTGQPMRTGGGAFVQLPLSSPLWNCALLFFPFSFLFLHFLNSFLFQGMCAASRSNAAPAGVYRGTTSAEGTQGPPVAGHRGRSKAGMKGGNTRWLSFPSRKKKRIEKHFQVPKLHYAAHVRPLEFRNRGTNETQGSVGGLQHGNIWRFTSLLTCILHFHWRWLHTILRSGMIQWAGSILDLLSK